MRKSGFKLIVNLSSLVFIFLISLPVITFAQETKEITDTQKKEFFELLRTLPTKGEFYTEESAKKAAPYLPVLFALTEKDLKEYGLYPFLAISAGIIQHKEQREYAIKHFAEIRHPVLKLFWAAGLFETESVSPEIVKFLQTALDSKEQAKALAEMVGPEFKFFKKKVKSHPFADKNATIQKADEDEGHADWVSSVAFSSDGKKVVSGSHDGTLILWDVSTGKQLILIEGHRLNGRQVVYVAYSPDGETLLSAGTDKTVRLWDATTGEQKRIFSGIEVELSVAFSPDGKKVVVANGATLKMWDITDGSLMRTFTVLSPYAASDVAFSPDGRTLIAYGGPIQIWDIFTGKELRRINHQGSVLSMALSPDGKKILLGEDFKGGMIELRDIASGKLLRSFHAQSSYGGGIAFSPDGRMAASESREGMDAFSNGFIILWEVATGKEIRRLKGHKSQVSALAFSPDGKTIISGSWDRTLKLWSVETGEEIRSFPARTPDD